MVNRIDWRIVMMLVVVTLFGSLTASARGKNPCPHKPNYCYRIAWRGHGHIPWTTREDAQTILKAIRQGQYGFHDYWAERYTGRFRPVEKVNLENSEN
jgi:hypothetical protein